MADDMVAIIPARAGSKGIKNKNIIDFCGKPLLAWSVRQALITEGIKSVYVSTDGEEIAETAEKYGAKVIWRPDNLSGDNASSESALLHAVSQIPGEPDTIVFLQATSPVRRLYDIGNAIDEFKETRLDSLFSMSLLEDYCIWKKSDTLLESISYDYKKRGRRQERDPLYLENGSLYIFKTELLKKSGNRLGGNIGMYQMGIDCSYEIDSREDILICEYFMRKIMGSEAHYEESLF